MECPVCLREWNESNCLPRSLHCGHSFCEDCLKAIFVKKGLLPCPTCGNNHKLSIPTAKAKDVASVIAALPKNFSLIAILNDKKASAESEKKSPSIDDVETELSKCKGICKKHGLALHSFIGSSKNLVCDKCFIELPKGTSIQPIPSVVNAFIEQVGRVKKSITKRRGELKRYKQTMEKLVDKNMDDVEASITEHFKRVSELVADAEKLVREKHKVVKMKQRANVENYLKQIDVMCAELDIKENQVTELSLKDASKLIHSAGFLEEAMKMTLKDAELDNDTILQRLMIDSSIYEKLAVSLCSHFSLALSPIIKENKAIKFHEYAIPFERWHCNYCEFASNPEGTIQCSQCYSFRGIDTFPNILYNPGQITEREIAMFQSRRKLEKKMICGRDLITPEVLKTDGCWYLISSEWLKEWKAYIFNKPNRKSVLCINERIGVLPPGPIYNSVLLLADGKTPKIGLKKNADYRGVNEYVWEAYWRIYGGGPAIVRNVMDVYAEPTKPLLLEPGANLKSYRELEKTQGELLEKLMLEQAKSKEAEKVQKKN